MANRSEGESEWGKLNAGQVYGLLAVDVDRALASAGLREYEQVLVQHVRELTWGTSARRKRKGEPWPDAAPCRIDFKGLAAELEVPFQRLYEAKSRLLKSRILVETEGGFMVNKNAHQWVNPGDPSKPRLSPAALARAASARTRFATMKPPPEFTPNRESDSHQSVNLHSRQSVNAIHGLALTEFTPNRECHSHQTVNADTGTSELGHDTNLCPASELRSPSRARACASEDSTRLDPTGLKSAQNAGAGDDAELASLLEWAESLGTASDGIGWRQWAATQAGFHTPRWWIWTLLFRRVVGAPRTPKSGLLTRIIQDWRTEPTGPELAPIPKPWELPEPSADAPPASNGPRSETNGYRSPGEQRRDALLAKLAARKGAEATDAD